MILRVVSFSQLKAVGFTVFTDVVDRSSNEGGESSRFNLCLHGHQLGEPALCLTEDIISIKEFVPLSSFTETDLALDCVIYLIWISYHFHELTRLRWILLRDDGFLEVHWNLKHVHVIVIILLLLCMKLNLIFVVRHRVDIFVSKARSSDE